MSDELRELPWMHVYGQFTYHSSATIVGTEKALRDLRDAIDAALADGSGKSQAMASDGEGYAVEVKRAHLIAQIGEPEYLMNAAFRIAAEEAKRDAMQKRAYARQQESKLWTAS